MINKLILYLGIKVLLILICNAEKVPLWPEGKIPDFQPQQIAATNKEVRVMTEMVDMMFVV